MKDLRKILWPFSVPYDGVTRVRNYLFEKGIFEQRSYDFPVIGIGNLSVGGTGKTPMTEYVLHLLKEEYRLATLSRGYGRSTKGFLPVTPEAHAGEVGDEPLQFATKFEEVAVAVCEDRQTGIAKLMQQTPKPEIVVLDDVFQHRKVQPGYLIMLTAYTDLFYKDLVLPAGNLREARQGASRAHCIVVTKCPSSLDEREMQAIQTKIGTYSNAPVYFSSIGYGEIQGNPAFTDCSTLRNKKITVVTGIAKPEPFFDFLKGKNLNFQALRFKDHHNFTTKELHALDQHEVILTTEKDYMRLNGKLHKATLLYVPIEMQFLKETERFNNDLLNFVKQHFPKE